MGTPKIITLLTVAAVAATPAAASAAPPAAHTISGCGTWSCGANHNEILVTTDRS